jgi:hypothetical protein
MLFLFSFLLSFLLSESNIYLLSADEQVCCYTLSHSVTTLDEGLAPHRSLPTQHTTNTREKYPYTRHDSNPQSQEASLIWRGHRDRLIQILSFENIQCKPMTFTNDLGRMQDCSSRLEPRTAEKRCTLRNDCYITMF